MKVDVDSLFKNVGGLTADEKQFVGNSMTGMTAEMNYSRNLSEMYSIKHAEKNTNLLIDSNKALSESTDKHAKSMRWLTGALVLVAVIQVIIAIFSIFYKIPSP